MTLTERIHRIEPRRDESIEQPRVVAFKPTWIKRMEAGELKGKVLYNGAWQRPDEGGAA